MGALLDVVVNALTRQKGKNGSAYTLLTDKNGTPLDAANPLPVNVAVTASGVSSVTASDGAVLELDALVQTFNYNGDGTLNYIQVTSGINTYRQTFTYTTGALTGLSNWVKQ